MNIGWFVVQNIQENMLDHEGMPTNPAIYYQDILQDDEGQITVYCITVGFVSSLVLLQYA